MRFEILHETEYKYSTPVFFEPHDFFLRPRQDSSQKLHAFRLTIEPEPAARSHVIDPFGNDSLRAWFQGSADYLSVRMRADVEIFRPNPFDYLPDPARSALPAQYNPASEKMLKVYFEDAVPVAGPVVAFSAAVAARAGFSAGPFLSELCRTIAQSFSVIHRAEGGPWPAERTLQSAQGSCRDLSVLFMESCRAQGLAARFTSGYFEGDPGSPEKELHAWVEVYVEGGGWRGFDPTTGLAVSENHIAIAAANAPALVSPVIGTYRGAATSSLYTRVEIRRILPAVAV